MIFFDLRNFFDVFFSFFFSAAARRRRARAAAAARRGEMVQFDGGAAACGRWRANQRAGTAQRDARTMRPRRAKQAHRALKNYEKHLLFASFSQVKKKNK